MTVREYHRKAMEFADLAFSARLSGDQQEAGRLSEQALEMERAAAMLIVNNGDAEPTRAILLRSAASLAIDCNQFREAEKLVSLALAGNPPSEIADELRDLVEQVNFARHLELRGIVLEPGELQVSIAGNAVGFGIASIDAFVQRVKQAETVIYRTADRILGAPFAERLSSMKSRREGLELFASVPRGASFAVSLKLGRQMELPNMDSLGATVIDEVLSCFELFNEMKDESLKERIKDEAYYRNFVHLARQIAPDGEAVSLVGLTAVVGTKERKIAITRHQDQIAPSSGRLGPATDGRNAQISVTGTLLYADETLKKAEGRIKIVDEQGNKHTVIVPAGMMSDIVRPMWEDTVTVVGSRVNNAISLEDIQKVEE
jgi:hypothetical protein